jgi:glycosyltransferase involved in cell wall biosynthesis
MKKCISIVTPCFNEENTVAACIAAVKRVFSKSLPEFEYEHIFIDNCSTDRTVELLKHEATHNRRLKIIVNARNFGHSKSPYYGMLQCSGDAVIPLTCDLQTPAETIPEFVNEWEMGAEVVLGVRRATGESLLMRVLRQSYYFILTKLSDVEQVPHFIGFGLFDHKVIKCLSEFQDQNPYFRGSVLEIGFQRAVVYYNQPPRAAGKSTQSLRRLIDFAILGFVSNSKVPLRAISVIGIGVSLTSLAAAALFLCVKIAFWPNIPIGIAPIMIVMCFLGGFQLLSLGIIGEYIAAIYEQSKARPLVIERERINW